MAAGRASVPAGLAVGVVSFAYLLALPPTLNSADESFLLYGAKRIVEGQALYRDFFDFLTPGGFYLYAAAFRIGGVSITTARVTTALLNAVSATCTDFLVLHVASAAEAILAALLVVVAFVPAWNMASHHWVTTTLDQLDGRTVRFVERDPAILGRYGRRPQSRLARLLVPPGGATPER